MNINELIETIQDNNGRVSMDVRGLNWSNLTMDEYEQMQEIMINAGATQTSDLQHLHTTTYWAGFKYDDIKLSVFVTKIPDKQERIAALKKELEELEKEVQYGGE